MPTDLDAKVDAFFSRTMEMDLQRSGCAALSTTKRVDIYELLRARGYSSPQPTLYARATEGGIDLFAEQDLHNLKDGYSFLRIQGDEHMQQYDKFAAAYAKERKVREGSNYESAAIAGGIFGGMGTAIGFVGLFAGAPLLASGLIFGLSAAAVMTPVFFFRSRIQTREALKGFEIKCEPYQAICAALGYQPKKETKAA